MAEKNESRSNHIFPLYLKAEAVTLTASDDGPVPLNTSTVIFNMAAGGANAFSVGAGSIPGQLLVLYAAASNGTNYAVVSVGNAVDASYDAIVLAAADASATLMWTGEAWALISSAAAGLS